METKWFALGLLTLATACFLHYYLHIYDNVDAKIKRFREMEMDEANRTILLKTFGDVVKVLNLMPQCDGKWFIDGGTLLGYHRHNGTMIPWDDDIDIGIFIENMPIDEFQLKFQEKAAQLFGHEYLASSIFRWWDNLKAYYIDPNMTVPFTYEGKGEIDHARWPFIDILFYHLNADGKLVWKPAENIEIELDDIYPVKDAVFEGIPCLIPNDTPKYLHENYGDLKICATGTWDHLKSLESPSVRISCALLIEYFHNLNDKFI